jgi:hypothetical protein
MTQRQLGSGDSDTLDEGSKQKSAVVGFYPKADKILRRFPLPTRGASAGCKVSVRNLHKTGIHQYSHGDF